MAKVNTKSAYQHSNAINFDFFLVGLFETSFL